MKIINALVYLIARITWIVFIIVICISFGAILFVAIGWFIQLAFVILTKGPLAVYGFMISPVSTNISQIFAILGAIKGAIFGWKVK